jgi:predicted ribosome quality control (RQC) complex YloA/Tae2 family protein
MKILLYSDWINISEAKIKFPNLKTLIIDDFTIIIGKDALSNDYLTTKMANEDDLWFHAAGVPGSHIIIRVKDKLPSPELIKEVSKLAAKNSKVPKGVKSKIVYCKAKFVKKTSDMKPGQVIVDYKNSQEVIVDN